MGRALLASRVPLYKKNLLRSARLLFVHKYSHPSSSDLILQISQAHFSSINTPSPKIPVFIFAELIC
jgi:hypothetical protein